jgi:hypothetical protein
MYRVGEAWHAVPQGLPLVALLSGYRDAGQTVRQGIEALLSQDEGRVVAEFDPDLLLDYRARRPVVKLDGNEVTEYRVPRLDLRLLSDSLGQPFLLLSGFEPDFRWERFTLDLLRLHEHFGVSTTTWAHSIPMPVPHTRPSRLAVTGNRPDFIDNNSVWRTNVEVPAHALHELEFELTSRSEPVVDLVVLIPHYLADSAVPAGAMKLLEGIGSAAGIMIDTESLRERDRVFLTDVDAQIAENEEMQRLIRALEAQYDGVVRGTPQENPFADADGEMPSADEIADELERYLSARRRPGENS